MTTCCRHIDIDFWVEHFSPLQQNEVHVHYFEVAENLSFINERIFLLDAGEQAKAKAFRQKADAERFSAARVFTKILVSKYTSSEAEQIKIAIDKNKKPFVEGRKIEFNISHAGNCILIAISRQPVGVDVEQVTTFDFASINKENFSLQEQQYVQDDVKKFYTIWARKEALLKAIGKGIVNNLQEIQVADGENFINQSLSNQQYTVCSFNINKDYTGSIAYSLNALKLLKFFKINDMF